MRYGPEDRFWIVTNPSSVSEMGDILFECSLRELDLQFKGGLTMDDNPTLFTDRKEAEAEARRRMIVRQAADAIGESVRTGTDKIEVLDREGIVLFTADLKDVEVPDGQ